MVEEADFAHLISSEKGLSEVELALRAAWFLQTKSDSNGVPFSSTVAFLSTWSIRPNINTSRLKLNLRKSPLVSIRSDGTIHIPLKVTQDLNSKYQEYLEVKPPAITDTVLDASDFKTDRKYIQDLVRQVNGACQFELYDCCAVMMRRLAEVLIIDAYAKKKCDDVIRDNSGNIKMMKDLINALTSGATFRLSRNAPQYLELVKMLGDTAAHSQNYITKKKDIIDFAQKYRMLIEELRTLN